MPAGCSLLGLQQLVIRFLQQRRKAGPDAGLGGLVQAAQRARVAFVRIYPRGAAKFLQTAAQVGPVEHLPVTGDEHRPDGNVLRTAIFQQFVLQAGRDAQRFATMVHCAAALAYQRHDDRSRISMISS